MTDTSHVSIKGADTSTPKPLLQIEHLVKHYPVPGGSLASLRKVMAVDDVSFDLHRGETLGIVGESGCGKSTLARAVLRLVEPTSGRALFEGDDLFTLSAKAMRARRCQLQMIFQDPFASLNPRMTVGQIVSEPWRIFPKVLPKAQWKARIAELLVRVGLSADDAGRYPHQFSGGQRQRIGIARALSLNPQVIVCDEPFSALDVSIQAQVINLLDELQAEFDLSYIIIAHDLSVIRHCSDRVAVMYLGKIVEIGTWDQVYNNPLHPYTQALISAMPEIKVCDRRERIILEGEVPSSIDPPSGCRFRTRCHKAQTRCAEDMPELVVREGSHECACFFTGA